MNGEDTSETVENGKGKKKGPRVSKKKLRRQQKQDRKQRELEESASRMGFLEDLEEAQSPYLTMGEDEEEDGDAVDFSQQLQNDPALAAELHAVERELAEAFPEGIPEEDEEEIEAEK